ncbi:hypothetical protein MmiAt1_15560 [Methanimicrococcus sp. At1]|uniref:Fibronectin type-III domain-containing protein n=1 Tax=Methanimicrococcus hacksteinii TaxID=3028293 RepID=A0ABU3VRC7_9EURY|nr:hypothetical protein [Methanimicrococcus sp. At1]MDV0445952.1 hypothetical protein [Methanimicrococcus sp. At1]
MGFDTTYYYKIIAYNGDGKGPESDIMDGRTARLERPQITAETDGAHSIQVEWTLVEGADYYGVYRSTYDGEYAVIERTGSSKTTYKDSGLSAGSLYYYKIIAGTDQGAMAESDSASAWTLLDVTAKAENSSSIYLEWTESSLSKSYKLYRSTSPVDGYTEITLVNPSKPNHLDTGLEQDTTYYYKVEGYLESKKIGPVSETASAATHKIGIPTLTATALDTSRIQLTWNEIDNAFDYDLYRSLEEDGEYEKIESIDSAELTEYIDAGLAHSTLYYYKIAVYDGVNRGPNSTPAWAATLTPDVPEPEKPNPGDSGSGKKTVKTAGNGSTGSAVQGFEAPITSQDGIEDGKAAYGFPTIFLLGIILCIFLYVRMKRRENEDEN